MLLARTTVFIVTVSWAGCLPFGPLLDPGVQPTPHTESVQGTTPEDSGTESDVAHDVLPLLGSHDKPCESCHDSPDGSDDLAGVGRYCWNCHEDERMPGGHYALLSNALDPYYRWDCGPCHTPATTWSENNFEHPERSPHGAVFQAGKVGDCNVNQKERWVAGCEGCHPANTTEFVCLDGCHPSAHKGNNTLRVDAVCTGCHVSGQPEECDSLP